MAVVRTLALVLAVAFAGTACATAPDIEELVAPQTVEPRPELVTGSVLDVDGVGPFTSTEEDLADLLLPPASIPRPHRLVQVVVDDPNGDGRIGDYWYPPRILEESCNVRLDQAPTPLASGAYVVGNPTTPLDDGFAALGALTDAPWNLTISVVVLDTEVQRDALLSATRDMTVGIGSFDCDFGEQFGVLDDAFGDDFEMPDGFDAGMVDGLLGSMFPEVGEVTPYDAGYPGWGYVFEGSLASGDTALYAVGERVILTVAHMRSAFSQLTGDDIEPSLDRDRLAVVIQRQIDRLVAAGYG